MSATLCPQQCVLVCQGLYTSATSFAKKINSLLVSSCTVYEPWYQLFKYLPTSSSLTSSFMTPWLSNPWRRNSRLWKRFWTLCKLEKKKLICLKEIPVIKINSYHYDVPIWLTNKNKKHYSRKSLWWITSMLFRSLGVGIVLAYHGIPTVGDRNTLFTLRNFPIPRLGCNICLMLFSWSRGLKVLWVAISQLSVLLVSSQYSVSQEQGAPQDHSSLVLYPNYNSIQKLKISFLAWYK